MSLELAQNSKLVTFCVVEKNIAILCDINFFLFQYNIMPGTGRNILVTGGGGYIGSHCILQLLQEDFNVIAVDNFVNSIKGMDFLCNWG